MNADLVQVKSEMTVSPTSTAIGLMSLFTLISGLPRIYENPSLRTAVWTTGAALLGLILGMFSMASRTRRVLRCNFRPMRVHYVQATMHASIYAYWGWYWPQVYQNLPLIALQIVFAYLCEMIIAWSRRDDWQLGFGTIPVVLSTNLFLCFKDDWFGFQFVMIAAAVLCKEFVKWSRDGRSRHIFNPSAIALFVASIALLATGRTAITWGEEIAITLNFPPYIYVWLFCLGLVVQILFSVTLVTLSAAATLILLNLAFTATTGVYLFVDSAIPASLFLGLHFLVTDPATSPRTHMGKVVFGSLYGLSAFALFGILGWMGEPTFYDKLLAVPALNLTVRRLDGWSDEWFAVDSEWLRWPARINLGLVAIWAFLFFGTLKADLLGPRHPGKNLTFWDDACRAGKMGACPSLIYRLRVECLGSNGVACVKLGQQLESGVIVARDRLAAGKNFGRACESGDALGCTELTKFLNTGGTSLLVRACDARDGMACYIAGSVYSNSAQTAGDRQIAEALLHKSCDRGIARGCHQLGEWYRIGEGMGPNMSAAIKSYEKACKADYAPSCLSVAAMYADGAGGNMGSGLAEERRRKACSLGIESACRDEN